MVDIGYNGWYWIQWLVLGTMVDIGYIHWLILGTMVDIEEFVSWGWGAPTLVGSKKVQPPRVARLPKQLSSRIYNKQKVSDGAATEGIPPWHRIRAVRELADYKEPISFLLDRYWGKLRAVFCGVLCRFRSDLTLLLLELCFLYLVDVKS